MYSSYLNRSKRRGVKAGRSLISVEDPHIRHLTGEWHSFQLCPRGRPRARYLISLGRDTLIHRSATAIEIETILSRMSIIFFLIRIYCSTIKLCEMSSLCCYIVFFHIFTQFLRFFLSLYSIFFSVFFFLYILYYGRTWSALGCKNWEKLDVKLEVLVYF